MLAQSSPSIRPGTSTRLVRQGLGELLTCICTHGVVTLLTSPSCHSPHLPLSLLPLSLFSHTLDLSPSPLPFSSSSLTLTSLPSLLSPLPPSLLFSHPYLLPFSSLTLTSFPFPLSPLPPSCSSSPSCRGPTLFPSAWPSLASV